MSSQPPPRGYIDPNFPNPGGPDDASIIIYGYTPSIVVGVLGCVLFFLAGILHGWQLFKYRAWYFSTVMVGIIFEIVGYIFRSLSSQLDPYRVTFFVIQYFFIVVAPVFFAAAIYTILSLLINATGRHYAPIPPKLILWIFISCDVVATVVQILGAALIGVAESNRKDPTTANNILLAGLAFQAFTFLVFIGLFVAFVWSARGVMFKVVRKSFYTSFSIAVVLMYLRVCFRLAETAQGLYGDLNTHEVYFGCLEFAPVVVAVWLLAVWHPGRCVPRARAVIEDI
ncbi:RTA1-domain-containing protein [Trematosphaeria pertusa]|uniref:RTA1-domain-containing protein n=1 Tax=Trematosphaeria pertusa TaxID=390896 RepID=A0A6A6I9J7_9PLEO|nr:RTA1-domain-containing protein [Trematosphaeria pertusa]KAF2246748.1 RTA1-domain-containing protein [Trematosphaeria pertusa]